MVDARTYNVHKFVFLFGSRCSGYFCLQTQQKAFADADCSCTDLSHLPLECKTERIFQHMLEFVYDGTLNISPEDAMPLRALGEYLDIVALTQTVSLHMGSKWKSGEHDYLLLQDALELNQVGCIPFLEGRIATQWKYTSELQHLRDKKWTKKEKAGDVVGVVDSKEEKKVTGLDDEEGASNAKLLSRGKVRKQFLFEFPLATICAVLAKDELAVPSEDTVFHYINLLLVYRRQIHDEPTTPLITEQVWCHCRLAFVTAPAFKEAFFCGIPHPFLMAASFIRLHDVKGMPPDQKSWQRQTIVEVLSKMMRDEEDKKEKGEQGEKKAESPELKKPEADVLMECMKTFLEAKDVNRAMCIPRKHYNPEYRESSSQAAAHRGLSIVFGALGSEIEIRCGQTGRWYQGTVFERVWDPKEMSYRIAVHYNGWDPKFNERLLLTSPRLAQLPTHTDHMRFRQQGWVAGGTDPQLRNIGQHTTPQNVLAALSDVFFRGAFGHMLAGTDIAAAVAEQEISNPEEEAAQDDQENEEEGSGEDDSSDEERLIADID